jgi:uncharacterized protein (DUF2141 family)
MLFAIIGLSSGFLLIRDANWPQLAEIDLMQGATALTGHKVTDSSPMVNRSFREHPASEDRGGSNYSLVSSKSSNDHVSEVTIPIVGQEQTFCVVGLKAKKSSVRVAVFESEAGFPNSELSSKTAVFSSTKDQVSFSLELPRNQPVAIAVYQDIDGNGKLSKNKFGIPTEPYGFSNNARGVFGPPSFSQASFELRANSQEIQPIEIRLR